MQGEAGAYLRLLLITVMWGSSFPVTKLAVIDVPPVTVAALRLLISAIVFSGLLHFEGRLTRERIGRLWRNNGRQLMLLGIAGMGLYLGLLSYGIALLGAAQAGLLAPTSYPILTAILARILLGEPLHPRKVAGLLLAAAGVGLVIGAGVYGGLSGRPVGYLYILFAAIGFSLYSVYGPMLMRHMTPLEASNWLSLVGCIGLLPWVWVERPLHAVLTANPGFWLVFLYLALIIQALSYLWWYQCIQVIGPGRTVVFTYLVPVWAVVLSVVFLREPLTIGQVLGGIMAVAGVALVNWPVAEQVSRRNGVAGMGAGNRS